MLCWLYNQQGQGYFENPSSKPQGGMLFFLDFSNSPVVKIE
jgi:hypothetical protein